MACLVVQFADSEIKAANDGVASFAGYSNFRVIGAATIQSRGVKFGAINSMAETEQAMLTVVHKAQKHAGVPVEHVIVSFAGAKPQSYGVAGEVEIAHGTITNNDIGRVLQSCEMPKFGENRTVLHAQPVNFYVDHKPSIADPRGMAGNRLGTDMHVVTVDDDVLSNIAHCVERWQLELAGVASSAYVAARSSLMEDEQEMGDV